MIRTAVCVWVLHSCVLAQQPDSVRIGYVEVARPAAPQRLQALPRETAVYRNSRLLHVPLEHPANAPLRSLVREGRRMSLAAVLAEGLRTQALSAWHPEGTRPYTYVDLVLDLLDLQGVSPEAFEDGIPRDAVEWEWLDSQIELITDEGLAAGDSRTFRHIRYIRLIWHHPQTSHGAVCLALFPFDAARGWLSQWTCAMERPGLRALDAAEFLSTGRYAAQHRPHSGVALPPRDRMPVNLIWRE